VDTGRVCIEDFAPAACSLRWKAYVASMVDGGRAVGHPASSDSDIELGFIESLTALYEASNAA